MRSREPRVMRLRDACTKVNPNPSGLPFVLLSGFSLGTNLDCLSPMGCIEKIDELIEIF